ncbi:uncharacterized protein [Anoplolepis gracilipes]|uniref:uncharacterized protein n=1 Tax=Anoplolepis gracilipes TaxID=354296 RepID=UPI003B9EEB3A
MYNIKVTRRQQALKERRFEPPALFRKIEARQRVLLRQRNMVEWQEALADARKALRAVGAVRPLFLEWVGRRHGALSYRLVQVLTSHSCFGEYLHRIGREPTTMCHHCSAPSDTAEQTLAECPAWLESRRVLRGAIGREVFLSNIIETMLNGKQ